STTSASGASAAEACARIAVNRVSCSLSELTVSTHGWQASKCCSICSASESGNSPSMSRLSSCGFGQGESVAIVCSKRRRRRNILRPHSELRLCAEAGNSFRKGTGSVEQSSQLLTQPAQHSRLCDVDSVHGNA